MRALLRWYNSGRGQICVHYGAVIVYWDPPQLQLGAACCFWPLKINLNIYHTLSNVMKQLCKSQYAAFHGNIFSCRSHIPTVFGFHPMRWWSSLLFFSEKDLQRKPCRV